MIKNVVIGLVGVNLDNRGKSDKRWEAWRPTISLFQHDDLLVDKFVLLYQKRQQGLVQQLKEDIAMLSPETEVVLQKVTMRDPWDFQDVYSDLLDVAEGYDFDVEKENYYVHITTGTHVAQICWFLLTESNYIPAKLIQTSPPSRKKGEDAGTYQVIDLDLSKYAQIASRFESRAHVATSFLKSGIETLNADFNAMIEQLEKVSIRSADPILLMGPTGAGKTQLASRIYQLKKQEAQLNGKFVVVNCATLRGDNAMSALFGHKRGSFTGAVNDRAGLLMEANDGLLFLDEIGELSLDEQAMLLRAIEKGRFLPLGSDNEVESSFQVIAGTNRDLGESVRKGEFREDLLARINLWTYTIPSLAERKEDIEPNIHYELASYAARSGDKIVFTKSAFKKYLQFAHSSQATWNANFRDLNASITRMATLSESGRINDDLVADEMKRLQAQWHGVAVRSNDVEMLSKLFDADELEAMDLFDQLQLSAVLAVVSKHPNLASAGRELFAVSRLEKAKPNDSHRLRQYLKKFGLGFDQLRKVNEV